MMRGKVQRDKWQMTYGSVWFREVAMMGGSEVWLNDDQEALDMQYDQRVLVPKASDYMENNGALRQLPVRMTPMTFTFRSNK